jgi:signal transduction histidine kinase
MTATADRGRDPGLVATILALSRRCARRLEQSLPPVDYAREVLGLALEAARCDTALLWVRHAGQTACHERRRDGSFRTTVAHVPGCPLPELPDGVDAAARALLATAPPEPGTAGPGGAEGPTAEPGDGPRPTAQAGGIALVPLTVARDRIGVLGLGPCSPAPEARSGDDPGGGEAAPDVAERAGAIGETMAVYLALHASRGAFRERVKELQCLHDIMQLVTAAGSDLDAILRGIVGILPRAWRYSDVAEARLAFDGRVWQTPRFADVVELQGAVIGTAAAPRGRLEVGYREPRPPENDGPFLREERALIESVAHDVGLIAERLDAQTRRARLEEQLRHAERLATIGTLAAGVAHELNEPLANVLGFGQLARKAPDLPPQAAADLDRVIEASLCARDVIRRLLLFARQSPPHVSTFDLNELVDEVLAFFEARWRKQGVRLVRALAVAPRPTLTADRAQLRQVLVNLLLNAAQAMRQGGRLTVRTRTAGEDVELVVEDEGCGMSDEVRRQVFVPFFTTKEVDEGTGLGLSVVHGIVSSHGGTIAVESRVGEGSRFTVTLPAGAAGAAALGAPGEGP